MELVRHLRPVVDSLDDPREATRAKAILDNFQLETGSQRRMRSQDGPSQPGKITQYGSVSLLASGSPWYSTTPVFGNVDKDINDYDGDHADGHGVPLSPEADC